MRDLILITVFTLALSSCSVQSDRRTFALYSEDVKDSFDIILTPAIPDPGKTYHTVYYLDANLRSGKHLRKLVAEMNDSSLSNTLFIGIGHQGKRFQPKRRRDFIPPLFGNFHSKHNDDSYGHADLFHGFLKTDLIPLIEKRYKTTGDRSLIGHSFGGLFVFYSMYQEERLFRRFMALSPSLRVNKKNILEYEKHFAATHKELPVYLYLSGGKAERINYILSGNRKMKALIEKRKFSGLHFEYLEIPWKGHHGQVPVSLRYILKNGKY